MSDDTTRGPGSGAGPGAEEGELQLRKALSTMNDLQPPRDDLFAQRALLRGRARTSRRRSAVLGAAAAVVVVGAVGGTWVAATHGSSSPSSAGAARDVRTGANGGAYAPQPQRGGEGSGSAGSRGGSPSVPSARDTSRWFGTLSTPQTNAFDAVEPTVASRWPDIFSGAYADDPAGARVAVVVTRHDPDLEAFVTRAMPAPSDVEFVVMKHSLAEKQKVAKEIVDQRMLWRSKGIEIISVTQDARHDQVVVVADEGSAPGLIAAQYGDIVRVVPGTPAAPGKLPDGSTLPPLQR